MEGIDGKRGKCFIMRAKKIICLAFAILTVLSCFAGCGTGNDDRTYSTLDELNDAKIGVVTGTVSVCLRMS